MRSARSLPPVYLAAEVRNVTFDPAALASLRDLLSTELAERPLEVRQAFLRRFFGLGKSAWTIRLELDHGAAGSAANARIVVEPAEPLLALLAAFRAGDFDLGLVEKSSHGRALFQ